eukprot:gene21403-22262_t
MTLFQRWAVLMTLPAGVLAIGLYALPIVQVLALSFTEPTLGLQNYVGLFQSAAIGRVDIGGADERVRQRAVGRAAHEILLVHARRQLDHLGRHLEERLVEAPQQRDRPFGQP